MYFTMIAIFFAFFRNKDEKKDGRCIFNGKILNDFYHYAQCIDYLVHIHSP